MNFKEIESLIDKINDSKFSLFELKIDDLYLKMDKSETRNSETKTNITNAEKRERIEPVTNVKTEEAVSVQNSVEALKEDIVDDVNVEIVTSPMVGTFYAAPGVDSEPFVSIGKIVSKGNTLCIIEAMKLMNEIESELDGEVVEVLVKNGEMVEFGTELFKIRR